MMFQMMKMVTNIFATFIVMLPDDNGGVGDIFSPNIILGSGHNALQTCLNRPLQYIGGSISFEYSWTGSLQVSARNDIEDDDKECDDNPWGLNPGGIICTLMYGIPGVEISIVLQSATVPKTCPFTRV